MKIFTLSAVQPKKKYFFLTLVLLAVEILIGLLLHDRFIRPFAGDFLVVILLYSLVRAWFNFPAVPTALSVLVFSCFVEWTQYFRLADRLQLGQHSLFRILIGDSFSWTDILCYTAGALLVVTLEHHSFRRPPASSGNGQNPSTAKAKMEC